jgi:DNA-binding NarL/FixJ family response regulator
MSITVGIIEDHSEFRQCLAYLIPSFSGFSVLWSCGSVEEGLEKPCADIVLLDISLPGMSGIDAIPILKRKFPVQKIIMLTIQEDDQSIFEAIRRGADGYLLKKSNAGRIIDALQQVYEGGGALTPMVARQVMSLLKHECISPVSPSTLTAREKEILTLIVNGLSNEVIARNLFISLQTVRNHLKSIYDKLQVHSRAQVVVKAYKEKLV